jgi:hypothetical protein
MRDEIPAFQAALARLLALLASVPEALVDLKPRPEDWSLKQIACHLVDSASNNHQRFTRLQAARSLEFPGYAAEAWVAIEKPEGLAWHTLLDLFRSYNAFILPLVANLPPACLQNVWVVDGRELTLEFLARDYYRHLDWHHSHLETRIREVKAISPAGPD